MVASIEPGHEVQTNEGCDHKDYENGFRMEDNKGYAKGTFYLANVYLRCACARMPKPSDWPLWPCKYVS